MSFSLAELAGVLALAAVGLVLYRKASADFEDEAFYEEQDEFVEEKDEPMEIPEGKPLDEFEDKAISAEPEIIERPGDSLISEVTASNADEMKKSQKSRKKNNRRDGGRRWNLC